MLTGPRSLDQFSHFQHMSQFKEEDNEKKKKKEKKKINWDKELELLRKTKDQRPKDTKPIDIIVNVGYTDDVDIIFDVIHRVMKETDKLLKDPKPELTLGEMGTTNVEIHVKPFCHKDDYWEAMMVLLKNLKFQLFRKGDKVTMMIGPIGFGPWELPGRHFGLAVERSDVVFKDISWQ